MFDNSLYIDLKYARLVAPFIDRSVVKKDSPFHLQGRCPVCGDSQISKTKARFHVREWNGTIMCTCFNCGYAQNIGIFLRDHIQSLYSDYRFEKYRNKFDDAPVITEAPKPVKKVVKLRETLDLPLVSELPENAPVAVYVRSRHLPDYPFYYAEKFIEFSSQYNEDLGTGIETSRMIIPFFDRDGKIYAYQGRDMTGKSTLKYITVNIDPDVPTVFGIDRWKPRESTIIVEGPLDSLFLPNCLAAVNAGVLSLARKISKSVNKSLITLCLDNEPRNPQIVEYYEAAIKEGYKIVIWPHQPPDGKKEDINDLVKRGCDPTKIIKENTYSGLMAELKFRTWKKI